MKSLLVSTSEQNKLIQNETERRRTIRLLQTRQLEKQRAAQLRQAVADEKKKQTLRLINQLKDEWVQQKGEIHENLEYQFRENLMEMGKGHREAADQPDYEHQWLTKTLENENRAAERGQQALDKLHIDMMQNENERNLHILHRKAALELEKVRAQRIAKLPPPEDPIRDLQTKPTTVVTVHDPYNFTTSRYHLEERLVTKEEEQGDAAQDALVEQEKVDAYVNDKQRLWNEQQEKARVRGDNALKREVLDNAYDNVLDELSKLERQDRDRRQKEIQNLPKSIFIPPWRREEEREEKQRKMETAFEQVYQDNHRKKPIPIVLMNDEEVEKMDDEEENEGESDRTLIAQDDEEKPEVEYRMATITPTVANTKPIADDVQDDDDEATLADPTIMTLQTPLPDPNVLKQQQQRNMQRLMEKIERQRKAAQHRANQQAIITPTNKTPKKLVVSPGYEESSSNVDSSLSQNNSPEEQSSTNTNTAEIEERRIQLESRKQILEEQIRMLSAKANLIPQISTGHCGSSSSDLSIESLLRNLRSNSNTASLPSTSSSIAAGRHHEDDNEQFLQAVQAIVTSDESQFHSNSSASSTTGEIHVDDDEKTNPSTSDHSNRVKFRFDKYESHSSEDRDHSLEDLISRLIATQQQPSQQDSSRSLSNHTIEELPAVNSINIQNSIIIDDLVDDVVSSISSASNRTPVDQRSISPEQVQLLANIQQRNRLDDFTFDNHDETPFYEEKRLIEQELEFIRRERENLLQEHENYRQQTQQAAVKTPQIQVHPPPSLLRSRLNIATTNDIHELSTIQEVDTPVSSRNTSVFHHRSPLKSSFDLQQLERISSADSSVVSSSERDAPVVTSQPLLLNNNNQQFVGITGLERDDSGISLIDGPRSSATSRTTLGGGNSATGCGKSSSSGIQSLLASTARQPRVRTITNDTVTTNTSTSANMQAVVTTPRSNTESDEQSLSSVSKKWRDILANECLPQLPNTSNSLFNTVERDQPILTSSLGFGSVNAQDTLVPPSSNSLLEHYSSPSTPNLPSQEQLLRSQYENEQCDLMSLIKVHEYLTKQQHPTSNLTHPEPMNPPLSTSTPPPHHNSYSTLTSVTYRSSLAKQVPVSGPPISTPSHTSMSSSDVNINNGILDGQERPSSIISDIHLLTRSPNTFETSMLSNSSMNSRNQHHDTLSYLIEQNQRAMQRLIADHQQVIPAESTTFYSSASMRVPDYESGPLTMTSATSTSNEHIQQKNTFIETGSLSTMDFPSALLLADEKNKIQYTKAPSFTSADDRGILDEPSITLLSNSYRSITGTNTTSEQVPTVAMAHSNSQQAHKKKQCSSPLSTYGDKTSGCSTPSLSPIKNESSIHVENIHREISKTPLFLAVPALSGQSPLLAPTTPSSTTKSISMSNQSNKSKIKKEKNPDNTSLISFERHELSASNTTLSSLDDQNLLKKTDSDCSPAVPRTQSGMDTGPAADWSYFISVNQNLAQKNEKLISVEDSTSSSSTSSNEFNEQLHTGTQHQQKHVGGLEFFIDGTSDRFTQAQSVQLPSLQEALQARRSDFLATSQKRVNEIKEKDYSTNVIQSQQKIQPRSKSATSLVKQPSSSSAVLVETDAEERQRRARESKERSKRLYDQLAEVQQKKKFNETKQQAYAYRARMNAFQTALDNKKKTVNNKK